MYYLNPKMWHRYISGKHYLPSLHLEDIAQIKPALLKQKNIHGLILDVDNTLTKHHQKKIYKKLSLAFTRLCQQFSCVIFSNCGPERHEELLTMFSIPIVEYGHKKPGKSGFLKAVELLNLPKAQIAMVGDRLLTDIVGANQLGIYSILVDPFDDNEPSAIKFFRKVERERLKNLQRNK